MHLEPGATERVLDQIFDDPAWREELCDRWHVLPLELLAGDSRGPERLFEHFFIEILVDPANRLVLRPGRGDCVIVQHLDQLS